ncbi:MAG TPA: hypothetical protein VFY69_10795, partial [Solirubrobacterales bacterium]|nr:hypothetical protein [Solirubrobacterales bacterium]
DVPVMLREAPNGEVEMAVIVRRPEDFGVASRWLHSGLEPSRNAWLAAPISLSTDSSKRAEQVASVLTHFRVGKVLKVSSPDIDKREITSDEEKATGDKFLEIMRRAQYRTGLTDLAVVAERVAADSGLLSGLTAFLWTHESNSGGRKAIVSIRLKQRPGRDNHLELTWTAGRNYVEREAPRLDDEQMHDMTPVDWDMHSKREYMLEAFADVAEALSGKASGAANSLEVQRSEQRA